MSRVPSFVRILKFRKGKVEILAYFVGEVFWFFEDKSFCAFRFVSFVF